MITYQTVLFENVYTVAEEYKREMEWRDFFYDDDVYSMIRKLYSKIYRQVDS